MSAEQPRGLIVLDRFYAGNSGTLRDVRSDVVASLRAAVGDPDLEERAQLVVSELATNAIQASPGHQYGLMVQVGNDNSVVVQVTSTSDRKAPPPRASWGPETATAVRGRGLLIVEALSDEVEVAQPASGTVVVTATFRPTSRSQSV